MSPAACSCAVFNAAWAFFSISSSSSALKINAGGGPPRTHPKATRNEPAPSSRRGARGISSTSSSLPAAAPDELGTSDPVAVGAAEADGTVPGAAAAGEASSEAGGAAGVGVAVGGGVAAPPDVASAECSATSAGCSIAGPAPCSRFTPARGCPDAPAEVPLQAYLLLNKQYTTHTKQKKTTRRG